MNHLVHNLHCANTGLSSSFRLNFDRTVEVMWIFVLQLWIWLKGNVFRYLLEECEESFTAFFFLFLCEKIALKRIGRISFVSQEVLSLKVFNCMTTLKTFYSGRVFKELKLWKRKIAYFENKKLVIFQVLTLFLVSCVRSGTVSILLQKSPKQHVDIHYCFEWTSSHPLGQKSK